MFVKGLLFFFFYFPNICTFQNIQSATCFGKDQKKLLKLPQDILLFAFLILYCSIVLHSMTLVLNLQAKLASVVDSYPTLIT